MKRRLLYAALTAGILAGLLAVTDKITGERERMDQEQVEAVGVRLGEVGLAALMSIG